MPTYQTLPRFRDDLASLSDQDRKRFRGAVRKFIEDLNRGQGFRPGLRVKGVQGAPGINEMTWAPDGKATWQYGPPIQEGQAHIIWRRVGRHDIFSNP
jgi:hypothetical protein